VKPLCATSPKPHGVTRLLQNFELIEAQLNSIVRGPHLRATTAFELSSFFHRLDEVETEIRSEAEAIGLDWQASFSELRREIRTLAIDRCTHSMLAS
jgi:hypothetical protein